MYNNAQDNLAPPFAIGVKNKRSVREGRVGKRRNRRSHYEELEQIDNKLKRKRSEDYVYPNKKIRVRAEQRSNKRKPEGGNIYPNKKIRVRSEIRPNKRKHDGINVYPNKKCRSAPLQETSLKRKRP